jgi:hypothetical protein
MQALHYFPADGSTYTDRLKTVAEGQMGVEGQDTPISSSSRSR